MDYSELLHMYALQSRRVLNLFLIIVGVLVIPILVKWFKDKSLVFNDKVYLAFIIVIGTGAFGYALVEFTQTYQKALSHTVEIKNIESVSSVK
jgi:hypothetical protein